MLVKDTRRQAFKDPLVAKSFIWRHPLEGVPLETTANHVDEERVRNFPQFLHNVFQPILLFSL